MSEFVYLFRIGAAEQREAMGTPEHAQQSMKVWLAQDRSRWDAALVAQGLALLERSASGRELTAYHVEAAIAAAHAGASSVAETDWGSIVSLYDHLMRSHRHPSSRSTVR
jgi:predicted RNA polymerase sigma factor